MTQYIEEKVFRSCSQIPKPYFRYNIPDRKVTKNFDNNTIKTNPLNFLMVNDTFHDLVNPRGTYNPKGFIEGPLNYLLTGDKSIATDNVKTYEPNINFTEFASLTGRFEPKVAKAFEINMGLQTADTFITYDDILNKVTIGVAEQKITINTDFRKKIIDANGSIGITIDSGENATFSKYIENKGMSDEKKNDAYLKISYFIRWYLHSNIDGGTLIDGGKYEYNITDMSMKILFDAGSSFLKEFFSATNSKVVPFVAIPCILDSASTSTEKLDPNLDFHFEEVVAEKVVPIVSNYFSCDEYFFCYLPNTNDEYNLDTLYGFSLAIIKITPQNSDAIQTIRNPVEVFKRDDPAYPRYLSACKTLFEYINANTNNNVARYFFGQVKKDKGIGSSCGTCGAGVPYIGRVISKIKNLLQSIEFPVTGPWQVQPSASSNLNTLKTQLDSLKDNTNEPLGGRIPFSDARILKIFCDTTGNINMIKDDLYSLFKILADYKRTGDYQQAYTVLKAILKSGGNTDFFTFCSGDELSALIGRLLGVPSIYQTANGAQCRLYRGRPFSIDERTKNLYKLKNDIKIIKKYCDAIDRRITLLKQFITNNYSRNLVLREKLKLFIESLKTEYDAATAAAADQAFESNNKVAVKANNLAKENRMNAFFKLISVRNAFNKLNEIISLSSLLSTTIFPNENDGESIIVKIKRQCKSISDIPDADANIISKEGDIGKALKDVSSFEATLNGFKIYNFIEDNFPQYFNNISRQLILISIDGSYVPDISGNLTDAETNKNLKIPALDINFVFSKVRSVSSLFSTYTSINDTQSQIVPGILTSDRDVRKRDVLNNKLRSLKTEFLNKYNEFIDSCKFLQDDGNTFKIDDVAKFDEIMRTKKDGLSAIPQQLVVDKSAIVRELDAANTLLLIAKGEQAPSGGQISSGGSNEIFNEETKCIQHGGTIYDENKRIILNDVKKLLLNLYNKCTNYIKNVQKDRSILPVASNLEVPANFIAFLRAISATYETDNFCYQLLFQEADVAEENTIDNINIGFLTGLKLITDQYTYADLGYTQLRQGSEDIIKENISINFLLNPNPLFNLSVIKNLLFLLGWSNETNMDLIDTYFAEPVEKYDTKKTVEMNRLSYNLPLDKTPPTPLTSNIPANIKGIFSIVFCSILEYLYYGKKNGVIYKFNTAYIDSIITLSPEGKVTSGSRAYALNVDSKVNEPSGTYLTGTFLTYISVIPNIMLEKLSFTPVDIITQRDPGPSQQGNVGRGNGNYGVTRRGGKQRKTIKKNKTRTNSKTSKTRKLKKTKKHKFTKRMKKNNRHNKRSRK